MAENITAAVTTSDLPVKNREGHDVPATRGSPSKDRTASGAGEDLARRGALGSVN